MTGTMMAAAMSRMMASMMRTKSHVGRPQQLRRSFRFVPLGSSMSISWSTIPFRSSQPMWSPVSLARGELAGGGNQPIIPEIESVGVRSPGDFAFSGLLDLNMSNIPSRLAVLPLSRFVLTLVALRMSSVKLDILVRSSFDVSPNRVGLSRGNGDSMMGVGMPEGSAPPLSRFPSICSTTGSKGEAGLLLSGGAMSGGV